MASILGYTLIALGVIILLATFFIGYGLYASLNSEGYTPLPNQPSINSSISTLTNTLATTAKETGFIFLQILILFLFASIGYKFADLGVKLIKESKNKEEK
ncbi:MAG: hypothetical protein RXO35_01375 [Candidatus Micrarchaeota archaeon]